MKSIKFLSVMAVVVCLLIAGCGKNDQAATEDTIGIIGAMDVEVDSLKDAANITETTVLNSMEFHTGTLDGKKVVIVKCDMGKVNAGACASILINDFNCKRIINTGVAGSLDDEIDLGDIVVSTEAVQHDFDVEVLGYKKGEVPYTGQVAFPADETLRAAAVDAVKQSSPDAHVFEGRICSGDQFISTTEQKDRITSDFGGLCCEMEGAAIAQICYLSEIPYVELRVISDKPDETTIEEYQDFEAKAAHDCADFVEYMIEHL